LGVDDTELVGAWWNGRWRVARLDVHLRRRPERWIVEAREGGPDATPRRWQFDDETKARAWVDRCIATGGDGWSEITNAYRTQDQLRAEKRARRPGET
jgi:hypothetical protein